MQTSSSCADGGVQRRLRTAGLVSIGAGAWALAGCAGGRGGDHVAAWEEPEPLHAAFARDPWPAFGNGDTTGGAAGERAVTVAGGTARRASRFDGVSQDLAAAMEPVPVLPEEGGGQDYVIPAVEILAFEFLLNQYDRNVVNRHVYGTDRDSIDRNLHRGWVIDRDPFSMNQFAHPYSGSLYHGFARSAGHGYWTALAYDFAGSALWEVAGERLPPSLNDQITTTFAGSFLGEALVRTADLLLGKDDEPHWTRSALAAAIAPSAAVNRYGFGDRLHTPDLAEDPAAFYWLALGARRNTTLKDVGVLDSPRRNHAFASVVVDYGMPGKPGAKYDRPFDYIHLEAAATTSRNAIPENVQVRGLLLGTDYRSGHDTHGIWGLYGTYEYFSPEIFEVSSTGLALGTTAQFLLSDEFALQGSVLGGGGYTAAGTIASRSSDREYRYAFTPQGVLALRLVWGDVAMLDLSANDYLLRRGRSSADVTGREDIIRAQVSLMVRVYGRHAVGVQYVESDRDPRFSGAPERQAVGAVSLFYTLLGDEEFGVVRR